MGLADSLLGLGLSERVSYDPERTTSASRYTTSAFLRLKLGEALARRRVAPHIFETRAEAQAFAETHGQTGGTDAA